MLTEYSLSLVEVSSIGKVLGSNHTIFLVGLFPCQWALANFARLSIVWNILLRYRAAFGSVVDQMAIRPVIAVVHGVCDHQVTIARLQ